MLLYIMLAYLLLFTALLNAVFSNAVFIMLLYFFICLWLLHYFALFNDVCLCNACLFIYFILFDFCIIYTNAFCFNALSLGH